MTSFYPNWTLPNRHSFSFDRRANRLREQKQLVQKTSKRRSQRSHLTRRHSLPGCACLPVSTTERFWAGLHPFVMGWRDHDQVAGCSHPRPAAEMPKNLSSTLPFSLRTVIRFPLTQVPKLSWCEASGCVSSWHREPAAGGRCLPGAGLAQAVEGLSSHGEALSHPR